MKVVIGIVSVAAGYLLASAADVAPVVAGVNIPRALARTYSEYSSYTGALILILTIVFGWLIYRVLGRRVFHWAPDTRPWSERLPRWAGHPSGVGLAVAWVVAVCTVVCYPLAAYMSWRYYTEWQAGQRTCPRCAERIKAAATMCRHCRLDLTAAAPSVA